MLQTVDEADAAVEVFEEASQITRQVVVSVNAAVRDICAKKEADADRVLMMGRITPFRRNQPGPFQPPPPPFCPTVRCAVSVTVVDIGGMPLLAWCHLGPSVRPSICPSVRLSICLSIQLIQPSFHPLILPSHRDCASRVSTGCAYWTVLPGGLCSPGHPMKKWMLSFALNRSDPNIASNHQR